MKLTIEKFEDHVQVSGDGAIVNISHSSYQHLDDADLLTLIREEQRAEVFTGE